MQFHVDNPVDGEHALQQLLVLPTQHVVDETKRSLARTLTARAILTRVKFC